jgi:hypothetical protein
MCSCVYSICQITEKGLYNGREVHELCTDFKLVCDAVRSVVLLGASAKLRKAFVRFLLSVYVPL